MNPYRQRRLEEILRLPVGGASAPTLSLREVAQQDQELFRDLEATLIDSGSSGEPQGAVGRDEPEDGDLVGPYRIERLLGRGGMGVVYLASRVDDFDQRVAIKWVDPGHRRVEILDRFFRERQILADLQHPNIARLLDGGSARDASPYLVMEYVEGERIDAFCESRGLDLDERLELFLKVCDAVQFAHKNLVVHRDLKPGNILVTVEGEPKLLDFGIAALVDSDSSPAAAEESSGEGRHQPMTLAYASPEQIAGRAVTTVSDVYSLGVLLYELLAGERPYRLEGSEIEEIRRQLSTGGWPPPSAVAQKRHASGQHASGQHAAGQSDGGQPIAGQPIGGQPIAADLDAIVIRAMEVEPDQRYDSVARLADDIRRYLSGRPVRAYAGSWLYLTGKLVRRFRAATLGLALIVALGITSTILWQQAEGARTASEAAAEVAEAERATAQQERAHAENVVSFLQDLFVSADPDETRGASIPVREVLDRGREQLAASLDESPMQRAEMLGTLGTVYNNLGLFDTARELKEEAVELRREAGPEARRELLIDLNNLARLHFELGDPAAAEPLFREALGISRQVEDPSLREATMLNLASVLTHQGKAQDAVALQQEVLEFQREQYGDEHIRVGATHFGLGIALFNLEELERSEAHLREALERYLEAYGEDHSWVASIAGSLGMVLHEEEKWQEAQELFERCLEIRLRLLDEDHVSVAVARKNLGGLLLDRGDLDSAQALLEPAMAALRAQSAPDSWILAHGESVWGSYLAARGSREEAATLLESSLAALVEAKGERDAFTRDARRRHQRWRGVEE
ncbi:MAG: serine/threonine-protein kinase [Acidobacteriota bacterium]